MFQGEAEILDKHTVKVGDNILTTKILYSLMVQNQQFPLSKVSKK